MSKDSIQFTCPCGRKICVSISQEASAAEAQPAYVSSSIKNIYHARSCKYTALMEHDRGYATRAEAEADGKTPCQVCLHVAVPIASLLQA